MLLPIFADAADFRNWNRWVRVGVHLILLGLVLWGLYELQLRWGGLNRYLVKNAPGDALPYYLDLAFLVLYAACWVGYGVWRLLGVEGDGPEFPDLAEQWRAAAAELAAHHIRLNDQVGLPSVFLVFGRPLGGMDALFKASGWKFTVRAPAGPARLRLYACIDPYAVFVTAPDATAWSYLCAALAGDTTHTPAAGSPEALDPTKTLSFSADAGGGVGLFGLNPSESRELKTLLRAQGLRPLSPAEEERLQVLAAKGDRAATGGADRGPFAIRADALRTGERELRFLCGLIRRDRWPLCPVNGVLVLVPWAAGEDDGVAQVAARELAASLAVARDALQLHYPAVAMVCDLETARGFPQFRAAFEPEKLRQRMGQRLPLVPARADGDPVGPGLTRQAVQWLTNAIMPVWVLNALQPPVAGGGDGAEVPNRELYLLLREVHRRVPGVAAILARMPAGDPGGPGGELDSLPLLGGCYLSGTGDRPTRQAFVKGVFDRLLEDETAVAWAAKAYADDRWFRRSAWVGYGVAAALAAAAGGLAATG